MVSPLEKNGGGIAGIDQISSGGVVQASAEGSKVTYLSPASFGDPSGAPIASQYVSAREPDVGWLAQNISTPMNDQAYVFGALGTPFRMFSPELSDGLVSGGQRGGSTHRERPVESPPLTSTAPAGYENYYLDEIPGGALRPLLTAAPSMSASAFGLEFAGASPDLTHIVVRSQAALGTNAVEGAGFNLYEWVNGVFQPINIPPNKVTSEPEGSVFLGGKSAGRANNAISEDGSRVVWSDNQGLYVRLGIGTENPKTLQVDAPAGEGEFLTASSDDRRIFFRDARHLTAESSSEGRDLYLFEPETGRLTDLTVDHTDAGGAEVLGILGASSDGAYLYFVANGVLAPGASPGDCALGVSPPESTCNLYLWHEGWKAPKFIATLAGHDQSGSALNRPGVAFDWDILEGVRTARVSRDGMHAVFMSERSLTGYDNVLNTGSVCGEEGLELSAHCQEVFMYEADESEVSPGRLICVSCNPAGARPIGPSDIPGGTDFSLEEAMYQSRVLSEGSSAGRVFFNSDDALVPQDTNDAQDVYEYEGGDVYLLSDGKNPEGASFVDASENGDDVFFLTSAQLVPQDTDRLVDLYDARAPHVPGEQVGFAQQLPVVPCEGEECRPGNSPAPGFAAPASETFSGAGNLAPVTLAVSTTGSTKSKTKAKKKGKASAHRRRAAKRGRRVQASVGHRARAVRR
jgi:hypothetical protein